MALKPLNGSEQKVLDAVTPARVACNMCKSFVDDGYNLCKKHPLPIIKYDPVTNHPTWKKADRSETTNRKHAFAECSDINADGFCKEFEQSSWVWRWRRGLIFLGVVATIVGIIIMMVQKTCGCN